jgi:UDP-N-acetylmuramate--alanine ligase
MQTIHHIHFVGIKGVGVAPLAVIAQEAGFIVTGTDIADAFITDKMLAQKGIIPFVGFDAAHIVGADLVITTGAHGGYDNVEVHEAKRKNIPVWTQGQAVGEFMKGTLFNKKYLGISVTGTHGKTTTSAMLATVFSSAQLDPSWVVGTSDILSLGISGHHGKGNYFIAEADEYATEPQYDKTPKFLWQHPRICVFTNIEHDHPDVYPTIESVRNAFLQFAKQLPQDGTLVICGDDVEGKKLLQEFSGNVITYGIKDTNTYQLQHLTNNKKGVSWDIVFSNGRVHVELSVSGEHNALNATAAYIVANLCGISPDNIVQGLKAFRGTKRRMEYIGQLPTGALLYDDYGHHPTEIRKTLTALSEKYPDKKIVCIFQPHTFSRTKLLFDQFIDSLSLADSVVLTDIYPSARERFDTTISSSLLVEQLVKQKIHAILAQKLSDVIQYVNSQAYTDATVVITMGAGDIYQIAQEILQQESAFQG